MAQVLVVERDAVVRALVAAHLRRAGHEVDVVDSARAATTALAEVAPPDVAVVAVDLPDADGFSWARRLRERCGAGAPSLVLLSGRADHRDRTRAGADGCTLLHKPFVAAALLAAVEGGIGAAGP